MAAEGFSGVVDAVESWIVLLPLYAQIPLLLAVLLPIAWLLARAIDPVVEWMLRAHTTRADRRSARTGAP